MARQLLTYATPDGTRVSDSSALFSSDAESICATPDGDSVAVGLRDGTVMLVDGATLKRRFGLGASQGKASNSAHEVMPAKAAFGRDNTLSVFRFSDRRTQVSAYAGDLFRFGSDERRSSIGFNPSRRIEDLGLTDARAALSKWAIEFRDARENLPLAPGIAYSPASGYVAVVPADQDPIPGLSAAVQALSSIAGVIIERRGRGPDEGLLCAWDSRNPSRAKKLQAHDGRIDSVFFTRAGDQMISAGRDGHFRIWHTKSWTMARDIRFQPDQAVQGTNIKRLGVPLYAFIDEGTPLLVTRCGEKIEDRRAMVPSVITSLCTYEGSAFRATAIRELAGQVESLALSRDGASLAVADGDHQLRVLALKDPARPVAVLGGVLRLSVCCRSAEMAVFLRLPPRTVLFAFGTSARRSIRLRW